MYETAKPNAAEFFSQQPDETPGPRNQANAQLAAPLPHAAEAAPWPPLNVVVVVATARERHHEWRRDAAANANVERRHMLYVVRTRVLLRGNLLVLNV